MTPSKVAILLALGVALAVALLVLITRKSNEACLPQFQECPKNGGGQ